MKFQVIVVTNWLCNHAIKNVNASIFFPKYPSRFPCFDCVQISQVEFLKFIFSGREVKAERIWTRWLIHKEPNFLKIWPQVGIATAARNANSANYRVTSIDQSELNFSDILVTSRSFGKILNDKLTGLAVFKIENLLLQSCNLRLLGCHESCRIFGLGCGGMSNFASGFGLGIEFANSIPSGIVDPLCRSGENPSRILHLSSSPNQFLRLFRIVPSDCSHSVELPPSNKGISDSGTRNRGSHYERTFCDGTRRAPRIPPFVSIGLGFFVLFYGILNVLIYVCFNERRQLLYKGLVAALIGIILLCHGIFSL